MTGHDVLEAVIIMSEETLEFLRSRFGTNSHSKKEILKHPVTPCSTELFSFSCVSCRGLKLWQQNSFIQPGNSCVAL